MVKFYQTFVHLSYAGRILRMAVYQQESLLVTLSTDSCNRQFTRFTDAFSDVKTHFIKEIPQHK